MSLSSSACPMMLCVRDRLLYLHQVLSPAVFQLAWHGLAERLDQLLYQDVSISGPAGCLVETLQGPTRPPHLHHTSTRP